MTSIIFVLKEYLKLLINFTFILKKYLKLLVIALIKLFLIIYTFYFIFTILFCLTFYICPIILFEFYNYYNFFFIYLNYNLFFNFNFTIIYIFFILLITLAKFVWLFLFLTIVTATITLMERKVLALTQRRVGPNYVGYKGRLQFIADAIKMLTKNIAVLTKVNKFLFLVIPALLCGLIYILWSNLLWGSSLAFFEIEYNLLFVSILSGINSVLLTLVGFLTNNKYSTISSARIIVIGFSIEILLTLLFTFFILFCESLSLSSIINVQDRFLFGIFFVLPLIPVLLLLFCAEAGRIPFDFAEAESELIAGYTTEYGGFYFALFYLGEYFHLFCFSTLFVLTLFGGNFWHKKVYLA